MLINKKSWYRDNDDGSGSIFSQMWIGENPKALLQIAHGMAEHSERYDDFARFLASNGYVVFMNDHAGHGKSAETKGYFYDSNGWEHVIGDMKSLMDEVSDQFPDLPRFLMGHSMGSFLARSYITRYSGLSGCVLSGTMGNNGALKAGMALAALQKKILGGRSQGKLLSKISTMGYNSRYDDYISDNAWLSTVDDVVEKYDQDEDCGFAFTAAGYYDMFSGAKEISSPEWPDMVPIDLPIFLLAGEEDPVGNYGKGVKEVYKSLLYSGHSDLQLKIYPGKRHEVLNEFNKEEAYSDILRWLNKHLRK